MPDASTAIAATTTSTATGFTTDTEKSSSSHQTTPCDNASQTDILEIIAPANDAVAQPPVTYRSTGVQTSPPANAIAFHEIYDKEPTHYDIEHKMGLAGIGRYKKATDKLHGAELGDEFELAPGERKPAYVNSGFQIVNPKMRRLAIAKAKAKAAMTAGKWKGTAAEEGFTIWGETKEDKIIHSEQFSFSIKLDKEGNTQPDEDLTGRFLPNIYKEDMVIDEKVETRKTSTSPVLTQRKIIPLPSPSPSRSASSITSHVAREPTAPRAIPALEPSSRLDLEELDSEPEPEEPKPERKPRRVVIPGVWGYYEVWDEEEPEPEPEPEPYEEDPDAYVLYKPARDCFAPIPTAGKQQVPRGLLREPPKGPSRKRKDSSRLESDEKRRRKRIKTDSEEADTSSSLNVSSPRNKVPGDRHTRTPSRTRLTTRNQSPGRRYQHESPRRERERSRDTLRDQHQNRSQDRGHRASSRERSPPRRDHDYSTGQERQQTRDTVHDRYRERSQQDHDRHASSMPLEKQHRGAASRRDDSRETHSRSRSRHSGRHRSPLHRSSQHRGQEEAPRSRSRSPVDSNVEIPSHRDRSPRKTHRGSSARHGDISQAPPRRSLQRRAQEDVQQTRGQTRSWSPANGDTGDSRRFRDFRDKNSDKRHDASPVTKERDQRPPAAPKGVNDQVQQDLAEINTSKPILNKPKPVSSGEATAVLHKVASIKIQAAPSNLPAKTETPKDVVSYGSTKHAAESSSSAQFEVKEIIAPELQLEGIAIKGQGSRTTIEPRRGPRNAQREAFEARKKEMKAAHQGQKRSLEQSDPLSRTKADDQSKRAKLAPKGSKKEGHRGDTVKTEEVIQHEKEDANIRSQVARVQEEERTTTATKSPKETTKSTQVEQEKNVRPESHIKSGNLKQDEKIDEAEQRKRDIKARIAQRHANRGRRAEATRYVPPASRENAMNTVNNAGDGLADRSRGGHRGGRR